MVARSASVLRQGNVTLGVVVYDKPKSEAQMMLAKLLGK
jgi:hypothetical protein